jgi:aldose 1-epimerase
MEIRRESLDAIAPGLFRMHLRGARVWLTFLNAGARIERWRRLNDAGEWIDLCLFYPNPAHALSDRVSMGVTVGRFANRIANGEFAMNGKAIRLERNESGRHHLHGGTLGFGQRLWRLRNMSLRDVTFALHSPHGDEGYPGSVDMEVRYGLDTEDQLRIVHTAICDRETIVNTTSHAYFNLHGVSLKPEASSVPCIMDHQLQIAADQYLHDGGDFIPSGAVLEVENTPFDFRTAGTLSSQVPRLPNGLLNTTYVNDRRDPARMFARLSAPGSPWTLSVGSDAPGAIFYNGFSLSREQTFGLYDAMSGFCIEPQNYPDCVNHPEWPSSVASPSKPYSRTIIYRLQERD